MTIINRTMYPLQTSFDQISRMQQQFAKLQVQLATGQKASNLAELGSDRYFDLTLRSRINRIEGYQNNIGMVDMRLTLLDKAVSRLEKIEGETRTAITPGAYGSGSLNFGSVPTLAKARLDEVLSVLNSDADGRYLFGGSTTDARPVPGVDAVLDGIAGRAGFRQVAVERLQADRGADGRGRLTLATAADTVTLAEAGTHTFGLKLSTLTTSSASVSLTAPAGAPASLAVQFIANPIAGESVTLGFTLPDGSSEGITLTGVTGTPAAGQFQIGANPAATAANFTAALDASLIQMGQTKLSAASNFAAAESFFNSRGQAMMRVAGPPYDTATSLAPADPSTSVLWYAGGDSADPRAAVTAKVDETTTLAYGVQANESGTVELVRSLAVLAIQSFPTADASSGARFDAVASRNLDHLSEARNSETGSIEMIAVELGNARAAMANVSERHTATQAQLKGLLSDIETAPSEEVAMQILALQTRLQASYQAAALVSQLSLANYLR